MNNEIEVKVIMETMEETFEEVDAIAMELEEDFPQKDLTRGKRRKKDYAKAIRKERIANAVYPGGFNAPHGYYRKGKIHCSCPMCSAKTNDRNNKSNGPVDGSGRRGTRLAGTHRRYGRKNYKPSDMRKIDHMRDELIAFI